jgi:bacterioferritin-associated ferredoxin
MIMPRMRGLERAIPTGNLTVAADGVKVGERDSLRRVSDGDAIDADEFERRRQEVIDGYRVVCICNKIRRGVIQRAIAGGASTLEEVRRRTRAATGPCGAKRCGPVIARMLSER